MSEPTFRQASGADAPAVAAVAEAVWEELAQASGLPGPLTAEAVAERIASYGGRGAMFLCQREGRACGFAALEPDPREEGSAVMGVWVLPAARRQGVGRELALMALEFARGAGYRKVRGTLPPGNEPALSFFSEIGALAQAAGAGMQYELPL